MNKNKILELLKNFILNQSIENIANVSLISNLIEEDSKDALLFLNPTDYLKSILKDKKLNALIISTEDLKQKNQIVIKKDFWLEAQKILCDEMYPKLKDIKVIGITGTNGKTSTTYYLGQLFSQNNISAFIIGTLGIIDPVNFNEIKNFRVTTPSFIENRKILSGFYGKKEVYIFEVSSHSLVQKRFFDIEFDYTGFTSFSQDHLDFHKTMDEYLRAKLLIVAKTKNDLFLSYSEDELYQKIKNESPKIKKISFKGELKNPIFKTFYNKNNFDLAFGILSLCVLNPIINDEKIKSPPGRFEVLKEHGYYVVIDFAHTPDALEKILLAIKKMAERKITTVFGCGGDRDPVKRPLMGKIVSSLSDQVIVTSDNPRFEDPGKIIEDIKKGLSDKATLYFIPDRKEAIKFALDTYKDSIVLIAGKGHEPYLDIKGIKYPYSDKEEVLRWIHA